MTRARNFIAIAIFATGMLVGSAIHKLVPQAHADNVDWQQTVENPAFRAAVIDVINSCIVENGIIFCN